MSKKSIAVMVLIETDDPRLNIDHISVSTAKAAAQLRQAVIDNLPKLTRVVVLMSEEEARLMSAVHRAAIESLGKKGKVHRPPSDYVPPTRE